MRLPSWIRGVFTPQQKTNRRRNRAGLRFEVLEDRCVPANHAPLGTAATLTIPQSQPYVFTAANFGFSDPNDLPANNLSAVKITTLPTGGSLANDGMPVASGQFVSVADINANRLVFSPPLIGNDPSSLTFQVQDDGGIADGGVDTDPAPKALTLDTGSSVNQAPSFTAVNPPSTYGGAEVTISGWATFYAGAPSESWQTPTYIVNGVSNPSFFEVLPGVSADGMLTYKLAALVDGSATFDIRVQDNGGTANGGQDTGPVSTFTIAVQNPNQGSYHVNTLADIQNVVVQNGQQQVSLRAAVRLNAGTLAPHDIDFQLPIGSTITLGSAMDPVSGYSIIGPGRNALTITRSALAGTPNFSVFTIGAPVANSEVTISNLTITNGRAQFGGGIINGGTLNLVNVVLRANAAIGSGGGLYNSSGANLAVWDCLLVSNSATNNGGAIYNGGTAWVQFYTEISGHNTAQRGGGILNAAAAQLTVDTGSSIRNNDATYAGGGICNYGTLAMSDVSVTLNTAVVSGGGLYIGTVATYGQATLTNVAIEGNRATSMTEGRGGGIYVFNGLVEMTGGCTLKDNSAALIGGGNGGCLWLGQQENGALIIAGINDIEDDIVNDPAT